MVGVCVCVWLSRLAFDDSTVTSLNDFLSLSSLCGGGDDACLRFELKQRCSGLQVLILHTTEIQFVYM